MARGFFELDDRITSSAVYDNVTPDDANDLPDGVCRAISIAVGGNLHVTRFDGVEKTLTLPAGFFPMYAARVWAAGTTATGITAFY